MAKRLFFPLGSPPENRNFFLPPDAHGRIMGPSLAQIWAIMTFGPMIWVRGAEQWRPEDGRRAEMAKSSEFPRRPPPESKSLSHIKKNAFFKWDAIC